MRTHPCYLHTRHYRSQDALEQIEELKARVAELESSLGVRHLAPLLSSHSFTRDSYPPTNTTNHQANHIKSRKTKTNQMLNLAHDQDVGSASKNRIDQGAAGRLIQAALR